MQTPNQDAAFAASSIDEQIDSLAETQNEQSLSSSLNTRIIHDLYQVYDHPSYERQLEHSLEHIWQRLEAKRVQIALEEEQHAQKVKPEVTMSTRTRYSRPEHKAPARSGFVARLSSVAAVLFVALLVGSFVLTLLATRHPGSNTAGKPRPEVVDVHMGPGSFLQPSVTLFPGMSLRLINDVAAPHIIENGYWNSYTQLVYLHEPGMPTSPIIFNAAHETHLIGPFNTVGAYHLFDTIHIYMTLTIVVQQYGSPVVTVTPISRVNTVGISIDTDIFRPDTITIKKGTALLLLNIHPDEEHIVMNGYWQGNQSVFIVVRGKPVPRQVSSDLRAEPGAKLEYVSGQGLPVVDVTFTSQKTEQVIGPFTTPGTYHFFDPIHVGMNLTVVVQ